MRGALTLLCACALGLVLPPTHSETHISPMPFLFARYGRSPGRLIAQRNDKWALTTRYGKRTELTIANAPDPTPPRLPAVDPGGALCCTYTGVLSLYTCTRNGVPELRIHEDLSTSND